MLIFNQNKVSRKRSIQGRGLLNRFINSLPFELHLPGYQFCGPGTKLEKRLKRGDKGINGLDAACKTHDIAYSKTSDIEERNKADRELAERAWERFKANDSTLGEKINSYLVTNAMKAKVKFGMGMEKKKYKKAAGQKTFSNAIKKTTTILRKEKPQDISSAIKIARKAIHKMLKKNKGDVIIPRVIRVPKIGGFLPLVPIITALGALGGLTSGVSSIAKLVSSANNAKKQLEENIRHNKSMESIAMGKGLYLKPFKNGMGIICNKSNISKNF
ncbi:uncharacterized protein LOC131997876 [Stomoxys calcitrans]|uniref:uncharacterized protein LOC131997876 n=1 Tax=Stomoxys calcitrans TaxID=35570 RepID=UPI0027E3A8AC|nr:uncharacterized protein LOC131997876 [Stomoxys calcitrans]